MAESEINDPFQYTIDGVKNWLIREDYPSLLIAIAYADKNGSGSNFDTKSGIKFYGSPSAVQCKEDFDEPVLENGNHLNHLISGLLKTAFGDASVPNEVEHTIYCSLFKRMVEDWGYRQRFKAYKGSSIFPDRGVFRMEFLLVR